MKFSEMPYERPDMSALKEQFAALTERLQNAPDYAAARAAFLEEQVLNKHVDTLFTLASVRHTIDTRDKFYDEEMEFANSAMPQIQQWQDSWTAAMLASPYRKNFAEEYGDLMFVNAEIERKAFSPDIMEELQQENELTQQYGKLLASAQIPFEDGVYTLSQLSPFKNDPDDARRLAAWKAEGQWYKDNQKQLDDIYDKLTHLRDKMGKKLGYEGYTTLGYYRMGRNCYTKADVEKFRAAVVKYLVPLADSIYREQAKRLGKQYPMSFADNALMFRSGNPAPCGDACALARTRSPSQAEAFGVVLYRHRDAVRTGFAHADRAWRGGIGHCPCDADRAAGGADLHRRAVFRAVGGASGQRRLCARARLWRGSGLSAGRCDAVRHRASAALAGAALQRLYRLSLLLDRPAV